MSKRNENQENPEKKKNQVRHPQVQLEFGWRCLLFMLPHQIGNVLREFVLLLLRFSRGWPTNYFDEYQELEGSNTLHTILCPSTLDFFVWFGVFDISRLIVLSLTRYPDTRQYKDRSFHFGVLRALQESLFTERKTPNLYYFWLKRRVGKVLFCLGFCASGKFSP